MSVINLCSIPELNKDYKNVYDFNSLQEQLNFMNSHIKIQVESNAKIDRFMTTITLNTPMDATIRSCDYLFSSTPDRQFVFYFINQIEILTVSTIRLSLTLDVWQTYHLLITLKPSYVVRQHVPRWKNNGYPTDEFVSEGSCSEEYVLESRTPITTDKVPSKGVYIYYTSTPIGDTGKEQAQGGDTPKPDTPSGGCQADGKISYDGFRFVKGFEGFTPTGAYLNGESFKTVGYGFTEKHNPQWYERHKPFPCSEQLASELFGELGDGYAFQIWVQCQQDGIAELLTKSMFDAMVSTAWNVGVGGFLTYDTSPYQLIKVNPFDSRIEEVWKNFAITSQGNVSQGLIARRAAEANIYFKGEYEMREIVNTSGGKVDGDGFIPERYVKYSCNSGLIEIEDENGVKGMFPCASGRFQNIYPNYQDGTYHGGIDLSGNDGVNIYPPRDNMTVVKVVGGYPNERNDRLGYGNHCVLEDNETKQHYWFGHMRTTPLVKVGDTVNQNTVLGNVGTSGYSTGPHLHYEIRVSPYGADNRINPIKYIFSSDGSKHEPKIYETFTRGEK